MTSQTRIECSRKIERTKKTRKPTSVTYFLLGKKCDKLRYKKKKKGTLRERTLCRKESTEKQQYHKKKREKEREI